MSSEYNPDTGVLIHTFDNEVDEREFLVQHLTEVQINQMAYGEVTMIALGHIRDKLESQSIEYLRKLSRTKYQ